MFQLLNRAGVQFDILSRDELLFVLYGENSIDEFSSSSFTDGFKWLYATAVHYQPELKKKILEVQLPFLPPGINANYGYGERKVYKTSETVRWENSSSLVVGSKVGETGWEFDNSLEYGLVLIWTGTKLDADAPIKVIMDMVTRKIGFDDKYIKSVESYKAESKLKEELMIYLGVI